ncbi:MAG: hypothetical protein OZSIB_3413 [Candidatus Ozemobacter sibiricus]|uniref:Uncharacterized protein n=1 Tax=Candidatus Ozemobacter sibiricus TaxID=2268124 RepID=A0A367ZSB1_9BACT|nr:MAG: hypothetical protein OZSIB_3413 [Candidatus Ozemobacter sibiricus]
MASAPRKGNRAPGRTTQGAERGTNGRPGRPERLRRASSSSR